MKRRLLTMFAAGLSGFAMLAWMASASNPPISDIPREECECEPCDDTPTGDSGSCPSCGKGGSKGGGTKGGGHQPQPRQPPKSDGDLPPVGLPRPPQPPKGGEEHALSLDVRIALGHAAFQDALSPGRLVIWAEEPHADLATPRGLSLSAVPCIVFDNLVDSPNGKVRRVDYLDRQGRTLSFICSDGVNGLPQGRHTARQMKLVCKTAGYEVQYGKGFADLFDTSVTLENPMSTLSAVRLPGGQVTTLAQSGLDLVLAEDGAIRQLRYPEGLVDVVTLDE